MCGGGQGVAVGIHRPINEGYACYRETDKEGEAKNGNDSVFHELYTGVRDEEDLRKSKASCMWYFTRLPPGSCTLRMDECARRVAMNSLEHWKRRQR